MRYCSRRPSRLVERERLRVLAAEKTRWGYRFLHRMLRREGHLLNHKVTYRLYREERVGLRRGLLRSRSGMRPSAMVGSTIPTN